jgi:ferrochelatase
VDVSVFISHALWKPFSSGLQELHDQGVTEVMLFLCIRNMLASTTTILELAEEHRKKYFPEMKFTSSCLYNKPDYLQNLADSIKGHLEGYDYDHCCFLTTEFQSVTSQTDITKSHCKIDGSCCNTPSPGTSFATVTNVTKPQTSCQIIRYPRRKIQPNLSIALAG